MGSKDKLPHSGYSELGALVEKALPGTQLVSVRPFAIDSGATDDTEKGAGYGRPLHLEVIDSKGEKGALVFHTASENPFGHQRRADRASDMLLAFDTFSSIPQHAEALDVGAIRADHRGFISLREHGEFYLLTRYVEGKPYAEELRALISRGTSTERDRLHVSTLARYLARLHKSIADDGGLYRRSIRDLVGSGEGIMGIIDGYPNEVPAAPPERLQAIEVQCQAWRWKLKADQSRLVRNHGDFHPFNIVFNGDELSVLDASRGCVGDAADDVACLSINYLFFGFQGNAECKKSFLELFHLFFDEYLKHSCDSELMRHLPPYFAWRGLVLANPVWYPNLTRGERDTLLSFVERCLNAPHFETRFAEEFHHEP